MASRTTMDMDKAAAQPHAYVEWSAVAAGTVLACAVSLVLLQFGNGLGLSVAGIRQLETVTAGKVLVVSLWLFWVQLMASMSGGYLAGRMRAPLSLADTESEIRDGTHGLLVWAASTLLAVAAATFAAFLAAMAAQQNADTLAMTQDAMRRSGIIFGFGLAASSIVSALAAWWMGTVGGDHRDRNADASAYFSFRRKKR